MIGTTISHYTILEKLGEGGMGVVYKARDTKLDRVVALKFLPHHLSGSEPEKARFVQEAKASASLNHPNICSIIDIQEHDGRQFIIMEFIEGENLKSIIKTGQLGADRIVDLSTQIAQGLNAAHEKYVVHRDIKSDNIMVTKNGQVKIMDLALHNCACTYAQLADKKKALACLRNASDHGYTYVSEWVKSDPDFSQYHDDPEFKNILADIG